MLLSCLLEFLRAIGATHRKFRQKLLLKYCEYISELSAEWLMRGEGEMLRSNDKEKVASTSKKYDAEIEIDNEGYFKIKIKK